MGEIVAAPAGTCRICLVGNPNAGKSTLFNALTGLNQKVANYPGVTVDKKVGRFAMGEATWEVIDLPGAYSLTPTSPDEQVTRDVLWGWAQGTPAPDLIVAVVDATNLERNLYLTSQLLELGLPTVIALTMWDVVEARRLQIDVAALSSRLGVPVVPTAPPRGTGMDALKQALLHAAVPKIKIPLPPALEDAMGEIATLGIPGGVALRLLAHRNGVEDARHHFSEAAADAVKRVRETMKSEREAEPSARYLWVKEIALAVLSLVPPTGLTMSDRVDRVLTHRFWGLVFFALIMGVVFQSMFTWARPIMDGIDAAFAALAAAMHAHLPPGLLTDLMADGVVTGVGSVLVFLPQISLLFFFLCVLEDSGYLARPAFAMDNIMRRAGLSGRSLIPLLSSFACAIPGIMSTRTISNPVDRLTTILVAPLMTCSARLPVYTLLIAAFIPAVAWGGMAQSLALLGLYLLGVVMALIMVSIFKRTILKGTVSPLMLELPPYRVPPLRKALREAASRSWMFMQTAGTIILALSIVLWFLAAFPRVNRSQAAEQGRQALVAQGQDPNNAELMKDAEEKAGARIQLEGSIMGHLGHALEPVVRPLGYDWKIGVGLLASFAAREVMASTLGILYDAGPEDSSGLLQKLQQAVHPNGAKVFTPAVICSILIFFAFACQCMSTVTIVAKETASWRWPAFMIAYMMVLAYGSALITYQGLHHFGWG